jgi:hypothetical protein
MFKFIKKLISPAYPVSVPKPYQREPDSIDIRIEIPEGMSSQDCVTLSHVWRSGDPEQKTIGVVITIKSGLKWYIEGDK